MVLGLENLEESLLNLCPLCRMLLSKWELGNTDLKNYYYYYRCMYYYYRTFLFCYNDLLGYFFYVMECVVFFSA